MLISHYTGDHHADGVLARLGVAITRLGQKGVYGYITHTEAIHACHADGSVTIASSSLRDGGVRSKQVTLNPANWLITDVPQWDVQASIDLLAQTQGMPYALLGALATALPGTNRPGRYFCNQWVATPYLKAAATFGPHHFAAICLSIGQDVTQDFFNNQDTL